MDAPLYTEMLRKTLLPFINEVYPTNHRFMADNDPKHTSNEAKNFLTANHVTWWRTPAKSPDCDPIENLWHKLKEYNRCVIKPKMKDELIKGIKKFWETVTVATCVKYMLNKNSLAVKKCEANQKPQWL